MKQICKLMQKTQLLNSVSTKHFIEHFTIRNSTLHSICVNLEGFLFQGGKTLEISDVAVPDTGRYTCVATNSAGVADRDYDLQVWGK